MSKIYIGTSGYTYPHWGKGVFYPQGLSQSKWLEYYAEYFDTVELNVTFYRLLSKKVFEGWYNRTPKDFTFVVKGSRYITHIKRLKAKKESLDLFFDRTSALKEKLSLILWQLPPKLGVVIGDQESLRLRSGQAGISVKEFEGFLETLISYRLSHITRFAFEFRNQSWFTEEIYDLLKKYNIALCIADSPSFPKEEVITADHIYIRFHGGTELYGSNYSDRELSEWAKKIKKWLKSELDIYCFFNNDAHGYAIQNARTLKNLVKR